jgi:hypothetical protein
MKRFVSGMMLAALFVTIHCGALAKVEYRSWTDASGCTPPHVNTYVSASDDGLPQYIERIDCNGVKTTTYFVCRTVTSDPSIGSPFKSFTGTCDIGQPVTNWSYQYFTSSLLTGGGLRCDGNYFVIDSTYTQ